LYKLVELFDVREGDVDCEHGPLFRSRGTGYPGTQRAGTSFPGSHSRRAGT
jgi:hypothetical protein